MKKILYVIAAIFAAILLGQITGFLIYLTMLIIEGNLR